jgi:glutamyl-tRNA reductase
LAGLRDFPRGTSFATGTGMSPLARALHEKFDEVCRTELQRLRRKTASLTAEERAEVDAMSVAVTQAIAARVEAALECQEGPELSEMVARLFAVAPAVAGRDGFGRD